MMPVNTVADFILYIAPGFIATYIYYKHYPVKEPSTFVQAAMSLVWAIILLTVLRYLDQTALGFALGTDNAGMPSVPLTLAALLLGVAAGYTAVLQVGLRTSLARKWNRLSWLASKPDSIWLQVNDPTCRDWAVVHLSDGATYLGWITDYSFDPDEADQDFILTNARRVDDNLKNLYAVAGTGVYLNTRDVTRIELLRGKPRAA